MRKYILISLIVFGTFALVNNTSVGKDFKSNGSVNPTSFDSLGFIGKVIPSEYETWIDDSTGYEITQWTREGLNSHPYFTTESFIDEETVMIYSNRSGTKQIYKLSLRTGKMTQMTEAKKIGQFYHLIEFETAWYMDGKILRSMNTSTLESKDIYDFSQFEYKPNSLAVTCDAKWLVFSVNKKVGTPEDMEHGPYAIYKFNLNEKTFHQITLDVGYPIGHVQTNPVDPNLVMYCWQWQKFGRPFLVGHAPVRIWWVNIDGTDGGPVPQEYGTQRTHETWTADGKYIAYVSKYRMGEKKGIHFMGIESLDGKMNKTYFAQVSPGHQNIFKDNKHWIVDTYNNEEPLLVMFRRGEDDFEETKILFRHNSTMEGQSSHPHPRISPNGKYVLFSTDRTGVAQVYTVKINLDESK